MTGDELHLFFEDFVSELRSRGVLCAITSGLACVHYGVAETTKDCDLLCHPNSFSTLLDFLSETKIEGVACHYRGNISPPLDGRWHRGGWTSHFQWDTEPEVTTLDIFGYALRESSPWPKDLFGLYAGPHTVAEMKRTNRDKDWPFISALGKQMVESGDERGWLHVFNAELLTQLLSEYPCPPKIFVRRPALRFAQEKNPLVAGALNAERKIWEELDRSRIHIMEQPLRRYVSAVRKARVEKNLSIKEDHVLRLACAEQTLPSNPLKEYGLSRFLDEAKDFVLKGGVIPETSLAWLPDFMIYFEWLNL
ncbi:MAG: hypothetical protein M3Y82_02350 [Verrucomicrobiota bacterium]|nr:hypothetical protein [Verrucomicrobiota bacterium]